MELLECIETRHSTRKFTDQAVPETLVEKVVEAGRRAPSGQHKNQNHFLVIQNKDVMQKLTALVQQEFAKMEVTPENDPDYGNSIRQSQKGSYKFMYNPDVFIVVANKTGYNNAIADAACAMENMMLMANNLDLGSCWINQLRWLQNNPVLQDYLRSLGMKQDEIVYASLSLGYAGTPNGLPNRNVLEVHGNPVDVIK